MPGNGMADQNEGHHIINKDGKSTFISPAKGIFYFYYIGNN